jgi:hypothetical protein
MAHFSARVQGEALLIIKVKSRELPISRLINKIGLQALAWTCRKLSKWRGCVVRCAGIKFEYQEYKGWTASPLGGPVFGCGCIVLGMFRGRGPLAIA